MGSYLMNHCTWNPKPFQAASPGGNYKDYFLRACEEYNSFGTAVSNKKIQVEKSLAMKLYGLKAWGFFKLLYDV